MSEVRFEAFLVGLFFSGAAFLWIFVWGIVLQAYWPDCRDPFHVSVAFGGMAVVFAGCWMVVSWLKKHVEEDRSEVMKQVRGEHARTDLELNEAKERLRQNESASINPEDKTNTQRHANQHFQMELDRAQSDLGDTKILSVAALMNNSFERLFFLLKNHFGEESGRALKQAREAHACTNVELNEAKEILQQKESALKTLRNKVDTQAHANQRLQMDLDRAQSYLGDAKAGCLVALNSSVAIVVSTLKKHFDQIDAVLKRAWQPADHQFENTFSLEARLQKFELELITRRQEMATQMQMLPSLVNLEQKVAALQEQQSPAQPAILVSTLLVIIGAGVWHILQTRFRLQSGALHIQQRSRSSASNVSEARISAGHSSETSDTESFCLTYNRQAGAPTADIRDDRARSEPSQTSLDSWELLSSDDRSSITHVSWVSAPARLCASRCFLPRTRFHRLGGEEISAAQLRSGGGDILLGPNGAQVRVQRSLKHPAQERDLVHFQMEGAEHPFTVTSDHCLKMEGPGGNQIVEEARALVSGHNANQKRVFDGRQFRTVVNAELVHKSTGVVEVTFLDNATVLAWVPPGRRPRSREPRAYSRGNAVACRGAPAQANDLMLGAGITSRNTFLCDASNETQHRALSVGARPQTPSWFSAGSITHKQAHPGQCDVCPAHHRQLLNNSLPACVHGERCRLCHMPHEELEFRFSRN